MPCHLTTIHRHRSSLWGARHFPRKIYVRKINKMPEFYVIFARKIFFQNYGGYSPVSYAYATITESGNSKKNNKKKTENHDYSPPCPAQLQAPVSPSVLLSASPSGWLRMRLQTSSARPTPAEPSLLSLLFWSAAGLAQISCPGLASRNRRCTHKMPIYSRQLIKAFLPELTLKLSKHIIHVTKKLIHY